MGKRRGSKEKLDAAKLVNETLAYAEHIIKARECLEEIRVA